MFGIWLTGAIALFVWMIYDSYSKPELARRARAITMQFGMVGFIFLYGMLLLIAALWPIVLPVKLFLLVRNRLRTGAWT